MGLLDTTKKEVPMHSLLFSGAGDVQSTIVGFIKSKKDKIMKLKYEMSQSFRQRGYDETLIDHLSYTYDSRGSCPNVGHFLQFKFMCDITKLSHYI